MAFTLEARFVYCDGFASFRVRVRPLLRGSCSQDTRWALAMLALPALPLSTYSPDFTSIVVQDLIGPVVAVRLGNALGLGHRLRAGRRATCHKLPTLGTLMTFWGPGILL